MNRNLTVPQRDFLRAHSATTRVAYLVAGGELYPDRPAAVGRYRLLDGSGDACMVRTIHGYALRRVQKGGAA
jgi:hypothetical protein